MDANFNSGDAPDGVKLVSMQDINSMGIFVQH